MLRSPEQIEAREEVMRMRQRRLAPAAVEPTPAAAPKPAAPAEPECFTPQELALRYHVSDTTIRRWFRNEPGILGWGRADSRPGKRRAYFSMRIPRAVVERVMRRMTKV